MPNPLFSIVIPTRNRAHLLTYALQSALDQGFQNYEVVVSDNFSADSTEEMVKERGDDRIRYVRTSKPLPMTESWEFALSHARGEWLTILCDDSVLSPSLLQEVLTVARETGTKVITWTSALYFHPSWPKAAERHRLSFAPFSGEQCVFESAGELQNLYGGLSLSASSPSLYKGFCHRGILERIRAKGQSLFVPFCPDYSSCAALLFQVKTFGFISKPMTIFGSAKESIGASCESNRGEAFQNFLAEFGQETFRCVPLKTSVGRNLIAETLLRTRDLFGEEININWRMYFQECYLDLLKLQENGVDVRDEIEELFGFLCRLDVEEFQNHLKGLPPPGNWYERCLSVSGAEEGFQNILDALNFLELYGKGLSSRALGKGEAAAQLR